MSVAIAARTVGRDSSCQSTPSLSKSNQMKPSTFGCRFTPVIRLCTASVSDGPVSTEVSAMIIGLVVNFLISAIVGS
jgi:hypothetical protein